MDILIWLIFILILAILGVLIFLYFKKREKGEILTNFDMTLFLVMMRIWPFKLK